VDLMLALMQVRLAQGHAVALLQQQVLHERCCLHP
jgi:hypothetical protein